MSSPATPKILAPHSVAPGNVAPVGAAAPVGVGVVADALAAARRLAVTVDRAAAALPRAVIALYRRLLSPLLPAACRFYPTCSAYADEAYQRHGFARGSWLTVARLGRCHPWCDGGCDPVPEAPTR